MSRDHPVLGGWVNKQRHVKRQGKLSEERIKLLEKIGFIWEPLKQQWQDYYKELKQYIKDNGHALVPQSHPTLGIWTAKQRQAKKSGKLSQKKIQLLEDIGFIWDSREHKRQEKYQK